jgi:hypothetical protein
VGVESCDMRRSYRAILRRIPPLHSHGTIERVKHGYAHEHKVLLRPVLVGFVCGLYLVEGLAAPCEETQNEESVERGEVIVLIA